MRNIGLVALCGVFVALVAGCGTQDAASSAGGVAVVDLDAVAKNLGRDAEIVQALQKRQEVLNQQLVAMRTSFKEQLDQKQIELGEQPTDEDLQLMQRMQGQAGLQLNQAQSKAQINLKLHQQQLINQFKEEVKPIAQAIAKEKGLTVIVTKNDSVLLGFGPENDITTLVTDRMRTKQPAAPAAAPAAQPPVEQVSDAGSKETARN